MKKSPYEKINFKIFLGNAVSEGALQRNAEWRSELDNHFNW